MAETPGPIPTEDMDFATSGTVTEPSGGLKVNGYSAGNIPAATDFNWLLRYLGEYVEFLASIVIRQFTTLKSAFDTLPPDTVFNYQPVGFDSFGVGSTGAAGPAGDISKPATDGVRFYYVKGQNLVAVAEDDLATELWRAPSGSMSATPSGIYDIDSNGAIVAVAGTDPGSNPGSVVIFDPNLGTPAGIGVLSNVTGIGLGVTCNGNNAAGVGRRTCYAVFANDVNLWRWDDTAGTVNLRNMSLDSLAEPHHICSDDQYIYVLGVIGADDFAVWVYDFAGNFIERIGDYGDGLAHGPNWGNCCSDGQYVYVVFNPRIPGEEMTVHCIARRGMTSSTGPAASEPEVTTAGGAGSYKPRLWKRNLAQGVKAQNELNIKVDDRWVYVIDNDGDFWVLDKRNGHTMQMFTGYSASRGIATNAGRVMLDNDNTALSPADYTEVILPRMPGLWLRAGDGVNETKYRKTRRPFKHLVLPLTDSR